MAEKWYWVGAIAFAIVLFVTTSWRMNRKSKGAIRFPSEGFKPRKRKPEQDKDGPEPMYAGVPAPKKPPSLSGSNELKFPRKD